MGEHITDLLEQIKHKEIVLPEFQREFTWDKTQVRKLFESLFKIYPTGSLLVWKTDNPPKIKNDAYNLDNYRRVQVLLDGQQRLTSLYLHVYGQIPPYYSQNEIDNGYFDLFFNVETASFGYFQRVEMENDPMWIRLTDLFNARPSIYELVESRGMDNGEDKAHLFSIIESNINRLQGILDQEYPVQTVPTEATVREAITVFDLINSQGTPLTQSDIVLAYMTAEWTEIRRVFKNKIEELRSENFSFDLTFMTRCMVGIVNGVGDLKRFDEASEQQLKAAWNKLDKALDYLVSFLRHKAYVIGESDLNTTNVLVPLAVYLSRIDWFTQENEPRFLYWMYAALYKRRYSGSVDTALDKDIIALLDNPGPEALLANLHEDEGNPIVTPANLDMRGVGHPLYNMMSIVIRAKGAVDWANGLSLVTSNDHHFSIQRHHIFPRNVLEQDGWDTGNNLSHRKRVHEIANRIPLTQQGNMDIFDKPPSEYLPTVNQRYPTTLEQSLIPLNPSFWQLDNYELFLEKRRTLIADAINSYMERLLNGKLKSRDLNVNQIISLGESQTTEFKVRFHGGHGSYQMESATVKAVAGMMNSEGGCLLIGVSDDGQVIGLQPDYDVQGKKNRDGFEIELTNLLKARLGVNSLPLVSIKFVNIDNQDICVLDIDSSNKPIFVHDADKDIFYIRAGNATHPLSVSEATTYIQEHFT